MGYIDLKIEHMRKSKHWSERHRRLLEMSKTKSLRRATMPTPGHIARSQPRFNRNIQPQNIQLQPRRQTMEMDVQLQEAAKVGDVENFITCLESFTKERETDIKTTFSQLASDDRNTFLHVAASYGHEELSGLIVHHFRDLITCKNHKGDSALHLAARGGHFGVVEILLTFRNKCVKDFENAESFELCSDEEYMALPFAKRRLEERVAVNDEGNTALHEALVNNHKVIADYLIKENFEAGYYVNKQGESPLYLAVEAGEIEHVSKILNGESRYMHLLDEQLTKGKSLVHAAISGRNIDILREIKEKKPMLIHIKDEEGLSPLDFASSIGFREGVYLLQSGRRQNTSDHGSIDANNGCHENPLEMKIEDMRQSEHWEIRHQRLKELKFMDSKSG